MNEEKTMKPNDKVQVREYESGQWRDAVLIKKSSYQNFRVPEFWDFRWEPMVVDSTQSAGGDAPVNMIRGRS
jgi:hypothetical protein